MSDTSNKLRVLAALRAAGSRGCLTGELCLPACGGERFGGRIGNLRDEGYIINSNYVRTGSWRYTLVEGVGVASTTPPNASMGGSTATETPASGSCVAGGAQTTGILPRVAARDRPGSFWPGAFHVCDGCRFRWRESGWPTHCPNCKRGCHWIASHATLLRAEVYVPLVDVEADPVVCEPEAAAA